MNRFVQFLLLVILCVPTTAAFAVDVSLVAAGNGKFSVNGSAMNGVAGIKLVIDYDTALLSAPVVSQGGIIANAMLMVNTNIPGKITIAAINTAPFGASGQIVGLSFTSKGGSGGITSLKVLELIDTAGAPLQASVTAPTDAAGASGSINNPFSGWGNQQQQQQQQSPTTATAPTTTTTPVTTAAGAPSIGTLSLGSEEKPTAPAPPAPPTQPFQEYRQPEPYQPPPTAAARADEPATRPTAEKKRGEFKKISYPPVLDRFKAFSGERTLAALTALFSAPVADEARQEPVIAVSDGTRTVKIVASLSAADDDAAPNFSASEAKIVTLKPDSGKWLIELLPAPGTTTAAISILLGNRLFELPLTLVAPVKNLTFSDKEISAFLKDNAATKPLFDLDGNGSHDYRDDYLYCGHYLLSGRAPASPKAQ